MADVDITRISSKGQVVIPAEMRSGFEEGDKLVIIRSEKQIILTPVKEFDKQLANDIEFARRTENALKRYEQGKFKSMSGEEFLKELEKW
jgi:AbrB family looped-hinge helix DNA binding protein